MNKELKEMIEKELNKFHNRMIYSNHCHEDAIYLWIHSEENKQILRYVAEETARNVDFHQEYNSLDGDCYPNGHSEPTEQYEFILSQKWLKEFIGDKDDSKD